MPLADDLRRLEFNQLVMTANLFAVLDSILSSISVPASNIKAGGYSDEIFITLTNAEKEEFECCICYQILKEAKQCINHHRFCGSCIFVWSTSSTSEGSDKCPMCRTDGQYTLCYLINNKLKHKRVKCIESNCNWTGFLKDYDEHEHRIVTSSSSVTLPSITTRSSPPALEQTSSIPTPRSNLSDEIETVESVDRVINSTTEPNEIPTATQSTPRPAGNTALRRQSLISASLTGSQPQPPRNRRRPSESAVDDIRGANSVVRRSSLQSATSTPQRQNNNSQPIRNNTQLLRQDSTTRQRPLQTNTHQTTSRANNSQSRLTGRARVPTNNFRGENTQNDEVSNNILPQTIVPSPENSTENGVLTRPRPNEGNFTVVREESDDETPSSPPPQPRPPAQPRPQYVRPRPSLLTGASLETPTNLTSTTRQTLPTRQISASNSTTSGQTPLNLDTSTRQNMTNPTTSQQPMRQISTNSTTSLPTRQNLTNSTSTDNRRNPADDVRQRQFLRIGSQVRDGRQQLHNLMNVLSGELTETTAPTASSESGSPVNHVRRMRQLQEIHGLGRRLGEVATNLAVLMSGFRRPDESPQ